MISEDEARRLAGAPVLDSDGWLIGRLQRMHGRGDDPTPVFARIRLGRLVRRDVAAPLEYAVPRDDGVHIGFPRALVRAAPAVPARRALLDDAEEAAVYEHYGMHSRAVSLGSDDDADRAGRLRDDVDDHPHGDTGLLDTVTAARLAEEERRRHG